ncbi:hypothetical protein [Flavobacterium mekongense]|uniref:hypothetical protein n=1 Tax=Flavobacterium mekongense TaxID=3379707 RepID=UPI0039997483
MAEKVTIELTKDEALIFFDFLGRFNQKSDENIFEHKAEQKVLSDLEVSLEKILVEPFLPNYKEIIKVSREKIHNGK